MNLSIMLDAAGQSQWSGILMMVVIVAIFYFFMIRPQQKRQKEIQKAREALKVGDKVITAGGIYGKIKEIGDVYMMIEIAISKKNHDGIIRLGDITFLPLI